MEKVITDENFNEVVASAPVVLVDFWAPWCGPCRSLTPVVDGIAAEYDGRVLVAKCNVDDCEEVPANAGIRSVPTLLYYRNGELVQRSVGAVPRSAIVEVLETLI